MLTEPQALFVATNKAEHGPALMGPVRGPGKKSEVPCGRAQVCVHVHVPGGEVWGGDAWGNSQRRGSEAGVGEGRAEEGGWEEMGEALRGRGAERGEGGPWQRRDGCNFML